MSAAVKPPLTPPSGFAAVARAFAVRALVYALLFAGMHLAGWRAYTSVLCGSLEADAVFRWPAALLGLLYVLGYLAATVLVPILLLAAGLLYAREQAVRLTRRPPRPASDPS